MAWLCVNVLVRSAFILLAAEVLRRFVPGMSFANRHRMALAAFVMLLAWPLLAVAIPAFDVSTWFRTGGNGFVTFSQTVFVPANRFHSSRFAYWPWLLWISGAIASFVPVIAGYLRAQRIAQGASPLNDADWQLMLHESCEQLGIRERPELLATSAAVMPFNMGVARTRIVLPSDWGTWTPLRRQAVLLHELAHIKRRDVPAQLFAIVISALWWFQPLCRMSYAALRQESEHACDALVLESGMKASDYATELLEIAHSAGAVRNYSAAAVAMARRGDVEQRLSAILHSSRTVATNRFATMATIALVSLTISASTITLKEDHPMKRTLLSGLLATAGLSAATIGGSLLDSTGAAVPNATASLYNPETTAAQQTATAKDGKFSFDVPAGSYILHLQKPGFPSVFREFNVRADASIARAFTLPLDGGAKPANTIEPAPGQIRVGGERQQEKLLSKVQPIYPRAAKLAGVQGTVLLEAAISADGVPTDITVLQSPSDDLTQSALEAVRQWRYSSTLLNGNPVEVVTEIVVNYTLTK